MKNLLPASLIVLAGLAVVALFSPKQEEPSAAGENHPSAAQTPSPVPVSSSREPAVAQAAMDSSDSCCDEPSAAPMQASNPTGNPSSALEAHPARTVRELAKDG
ncbi:MAG: hypothetical protein N2322_01350, partial [Terrimicrobiaceae bacterium]|nr:hypothetical protein [Terrimicrobiaceae bacterium]